MIAAFVFQFLVVMIIYTIYLQKTIKRLIMVADMNLVKIFFNVTNTHLSPDYFQFDFCLPKFGNISSLKDMIRLKIYKNINILSLKLQEGI